jgi:hypothetical protein
MLNTTRPSFRMLALENCALTSLGVAQAALNVSRYQVIPGSIESEYACELDQKAFSVERAIMRKRAS